MKGPNPALHLLSIDKVLRESLNGSMWIQAEQRLNYSLGELRHWEQAMKVPKHTPLWIPNVMVERQLIQDTDTQRLNFLLTSHDKLLR